jgi:hypothetical protein
MLEQREYSGGYHTYGGGIGIMMLDTTFARPPGDVGNARTYDYPVFYDVVTDASAERVVREQDPSLIDPFVESANDLVDRGAVAITTSCGFTLMFQEELSERVEGIPVFTSSLLQIPLIKSMISPSKRIAILSADEKRIRRIDHPVLMGNEDRLIYEGVSDHAPFQDTIITGDVDQIDLNAVGEGVVAAAERATANDDVGAIIFECTNLRPYVDLVQNATNLPVFDYLTLADMAWRAADGTRF